MELPHPLASMLAVAALAIVHLFAGKIRLLSGPPRSIWLSGGGGVSVAYVFVHLLPELAHTQTTIAEAAGGLLAYLEHHSYLLALVGLGLFYGLERLATQSRAEGRREHGADTTSQGVFWLHIASFAVYNALIGYLLVHREEDGYAILFLFTGAMALHFVVNDYGLRAHHKHSYDYLGRWILVLAIVFGWGLSLLVEISEAALGIVFAFVAGGVVLNVLKEELPEERESRFWAFALGALLYAVLLVIVV
jgi:zinc transporter ZupT